jgi:WXXGXW repeat (2 copies)
MKTKLLALLLVGGSSLFAGSRVFFGIGVGGPAYGYYPPPVYAYAPPPPVVGYAAPIYARPGYSWVGGYWYPVGPRYYWHAGYWGRPPYAGAFWVGPRYYGHRYYPGYWGRR